MKVILLIASCTAVLGFTTPLVATTRGSALYDASSLRPDGKRGEYDQPLHTKESTKSELSPNALSKRERAALPDVMLDPDYMLTLGVALLCPLIIWYHPCK